MKHTINTIANQYSAFLKAGTSYGEALKNAARETSVSHPELLAALARVHAQHFKCNTTWSNKGTAVFHTGAESTRDSRHVAAQKSWSRNVGVHFSTGATTRQHKPVDAVAKLAKAYAGLTAAQKKRFLAML
jgi:hypothetical protein